MTAGSISLDEFRSLVENFVDISNKIDDQWHLDSGVQGTSYMCKRCIKTPEELCSPKVFNADAVSRSLVTESETSSTPLSSSTSPTPQDKRTLSSGEGEEAAKEDRDEDAVDNMEIEAEDDGNCMPITESVGQTPLTYEYHIVYSDSYNVPVLYFNIFTPDGKLLPLENVWKLCPAAYQGYLAENKWATLTQQEHPLLGRPYLQLHPCHTADLMAQVLANTGDQGKQNYLATWLSTVGPMVGLHISPDYVTKSTAVSSKSTTVSLLSPQ